MTVTQIILVVMAVVVAYWAVRIPLANFRS